MAGEQLAMFVEAQTVKNGRLNVIHATDGRTLISVDTNRGGAWLELQPEDQRWLAESVVNWEYNSPQPDVPGAADLPAQNRRLRADLEAAQEQLRLCREQYAVLVETQPTQFSQRRVAAAVEARGYRRDWTPEQFAARQIAKLGEELGEFAGAFRGLPTVMRSELVVLSLAARTAFDKPRYWDMVQMWDRKKAREELADILVVALVAAEALEFDGLAAAVEKAERDVARGVRGAQDGEA